MCSFYYVFARNLLQREFILPTISLLLFMLIKDYVLQFFSTISAKKYSFIDCQVQCSKLTPARKRGSRKVAVYCGAVCEIGRKKK